MHRRKPTVSGSWTGSLTTGAAMGLVVLFWPSLWPWSLPAALIAGAAVGRFWLRPRLRRIDAQREISLRNMLERAGLQIHDVIPGAALGHPQWHAFVVVAPKRHAPIAGPRRPPIVADPDGVRWV